MSHCRLSQASELWGELVPEYEQCLLIHPSVLSAKGVASAPRKAAGTQQCNENMVTMGRVA